MGNLFSTFNSKFDASFIFFFLKKMNLEYIKSGNKLSDIHITHKLSDVYFELSKFFNLEQTCKKIKSKNLKTLAKNIDEPLFIEVNSKHLLYHSSYKINKWNYAHSLIILEIKDSIAIVSDCFIPKINGSDIFEGEANLKNIDNAWRKNNYCYFDYSSLASCIEKFNIDYDLCKNIFIENMKIFLTESINAQKKFAVDLPNYLINYSTKDIKKNLNKIPLQLHMLGLIASRTYLKEFLVNHLAYNNSDIITFIEKDINNWSKVCILIYKASFICTTESFESIKKKILNITQEENSIFSRLLFEITNKLIKN